MRVHWRIKDPCTSRLVNGMLEPTTGLHACFCLVESHRVGLRGFLKGLEGRAAQPHGAIRKLGASDMALVLPRGHRVVLRGWRALRGAPSRHRWGRSSRLADSALCGRAPGLALAYRPCGPRAVGR